MNLTTLEVNIEAKVTVTDDTVRDCLSLIGIWMDNNPDKRIVGHCEDGKTRFTIEPIEPPKEGDGE